MNILAYASLSSQASINYRLMGVCVCGSLCVSVPWKAMWPDLVVLVGLYYLLLVLGGGEPPPGQVHLYHSL